MNTADDDPFADARAEGRGKLRAGIYCRMSLAAMGDTTKVDDQQRICQDLAGRLGWEVVDVYPDNSKSAWQLNRKRPEWDRMLGDVETGRLNAIITYHGDRLVRRHEDLSALLKLARSKGIRLASPTGTRDLDNDDDQFILEVECSMAKRESANTSRRRKTQYERWRRGGRVFAGGPGGRRYGFTGDGLTHVETECGIIREMARRVLAGEAAGAIARDLNDRGERTQSGAQWTHSSVGRLLSRARYAGLMPDGESAAAWEPVLDRETWERVRLALDARAGLNPAPTNTRRWLLSGLAVCGAPAGEGICGTPLDITLTGSAPGRPARPAYGCNRKGCGRVRRNAALLDGFVAAAVVTRLNDPRNPAARRPKRADTAPEWRALMTERGETEQLAMSYGASPGRVRLLMARLDSIDARLAELREQEADDAGARLLEQHAGITLEEFEDETLTVQRALVSKCYRVVVLPASRRGPGFHTEDVRLERPR